MNNLYGNELIGWNQSNKYLVFPIKEIPIISEAITLSPKEKSQIIEALLLSLDNPNSKIEKVWKIKVEKRLESIENGSTKTISYDEIF